VFVILYAVRWKHLPCKHSDTTGNPGHFVERNECCYVLPGVANAKAPRSRLSNDFIGHHVNQAAEDEHVY
jgi:hypothetical protein